MEVTLKYLLTVFAIHMNLYLMNTANLISEDNDGDHAGEKERLVYIVNGADIGWRSNWQYGKYRDPDNNTYKVWMDEKM